MKCTCPCPDWFCPVHDPEMTEKMDVLLDWLEREMIIPKRKINP